VSTIRTADFLQGGKRKSMLRLACAEFIPPAILQRFDKIGFYTPLDTWLQQHVQAVDGEIARLMPGPLPSNVQQYVADYKAGRRSVAGGQLLWRLYLTAKWKQMFINGQPEGRP
jgi:hypothetical protein